MSTSALQPVASSSPPTCVFGKTPKSTMAAAPTPLQEGMEQHVCQVLKERSGNKVRAAEMLASADRPFSGCWILD
jgi:hypothetical protein